MKLKKRLGNAAFFLGGILVAAGLMFAYLNVREAHADQYSCIRTDLDAAGMTGNIPDPSFTITYIVPSCYASNGYHVDKVFMYGDRVAVTYSNE